MANFRIVENPADNVAGVESWFVELYHARHSMHDIMEILDVSNHQYNKLVRRCAEKGLIVPRSQGRRKRSC